MSKSVEGIFHDGKVELEHVPADVPDETRVIITFPDSSYDLQQRGIDQYQAADLRARLKAFAEDWESPEMDLYDDYDAVKSNL